MMKAQGKRLWSDAFSRLRHDRIAMICFVIISGYFILAILCKTGIAFPSFSVVDNSQTYQAPSVQHWFGTDIFGRDVLARAAHGTVT
jgi:ABC-type dipeptide/oligopeptide/nickel transport system permease subunit